MFDGCRKVRPWGCHLKPANYLEAQYYFLLRPNSIVSINRGAGGITISSNTLTNRKKRYWVRFNSIGIFIVNFSFSVSYTQALPDNFLSEVRFYQHEKSGESTSGAGTSTFIRRYITNRITSLHSTDTIQVQALVHFTRATVSTANRYFTWSMRFARVNITNFTATIETIDQFNGFMTLEKVSTNPG